MKSGNSTANLPDDLDWPAKAGVAKEMASKIREKAKVHDARRTTRRRRLGAGGAGLAALVILAFWAVPVVRDTSTVNTVAAVRQRLELKDGSHADLNARTSLHTDFRYGRRIVRLDSGEAFFSVVKDQTSPFLVETPAGTVRVTGTKFNVRLNDKGAAEVTLLEGAVGFETTGPAPRNVLLQPSQQLQSNESEVRTLSAAGLDSVTAWRDGRLALDGLTLGGAIDRLSSFHGVTINVSPEAAGLSADGSIAIDNLAGALDALQVLLPINVLPSGQGSYRIVRR